MTSMLKPTKLKGVIAAIATAVGPDGTPDCGRSTALARFLLANGCDGLNVLGTTGEATSLSLDQRKSVMSAYAAAGLPMERLMVGTGAAALADAVALTRHAAALGFAGALLLPPFYYKGVPDDGLVAYVQAIAQATAATPIPLYLYNFPAQSGLKWHIGLIQRLLATLGERIVGLKDSSGDMAYARQAAEHFRRFCCISFHGSGADGRALRSISRGAYLQPRISTLTSARGHGATAIRMRSSLRWRSVAYSTASSWYRV